MTAIFFYLAQLETNFEDSIPLTEGAERIFEVGREASEAVALNFEPLWRGVIQGGLYTAMANIGSLIAAVALGFFLVQMAQQFISNQNDYAISELIWPVIVISFLANDGAMLGSATLELRSIGNQVNNTMLASAVKNKSLQDEFQDSQKNDSINTNLAVSISECRENYPAIQPIKRRECYSKAQAKAKAERQKYGLVEVKQSFWPRAALQYLLRNFLWALHKAVQWVIEITLLTMALLGPIAMGLTLMPGTNKAIFAWLSGIASIFLIKLTLNLISGLAAYAISLQDNYANSMVLPLILAILAPIMSVMVGLQGGSALYNALSYAGVYSGMRGAIALTKRSSVGTYRLIRRKGRG